jgi:hypothetical protein
MTDMFRIVEGSRVKRARELREQMEAAVEADDQLERARNYLAALRRERDSKTRRLENLRTHAETIYIAKDGTGLAPVPGLVVGGTIGDLIPGEEDNLAAIDQQIAEREHALTDLEKHIA